MVLAGCLVFITAAAFGCGSAREEASSPDRTLQERASEHGNTPAASHSEREQTAGKQEKSADSEKEESEESKPPVRESENRETNNDALVIVDREYELPRDYEPEDLVALSEHDVPRVQDREMRLREEAAKALSGLIVAADSAGVELVVRSAYRSYEHQTSSYENWTAVYGEQESGLSAPPGHSEHQLGTVADFTNAEAGYELGQWFGDTEASEWLTTNAARHGFIMSYPKDSRQETGYRWEPWHYRYIGPDNAARYKESEYASPRQFLLEEGVKPSGSEDTRTRSASSSDKEGAQDDSTLRGAG